MRIGIIAIVGFLISAFSIVLMLIVPTYFNSFGVAVVRLMQVSFAGLSIFGLAISVDNALSNKKNEDDD